MANINIKLMAPKDVNPSKNEVIQSVFALCETGKRKKAFQVFAKIKIYFFRLEKET